MTYIPQHTASKNYSRGMAAPIWWNPITGFYQPHGAGVGPWEAPAISLNAGPNEWPRSAHAINLVPADEVIAGNFYSLPRWPVLNDPPSWANKWDWVIAGAKNVDNFFELRLVYVYNEQHWLSAFAGFSNYDFVPEFTAPPVPFAEIHKYSTVPRAEHWLRMELHQVKNGIRNVLSAVDIPNLEFSRIARASAHKAIRLACLRGTDQTTLVGCYSLNSVDGNWLTNDYTSYKSFFVTAQVESNDVGFFCAGPAGQNSFFRTIDPHRKILISDNNAPPAVYLEPHHLGDNYPPKSLLTIAAPSGFGRQINIADATQMGRLRHSSGEIDFLPELAAPIVPGHSINQQVLMPPSPEWASWESTPIPPPQVLRMRFSPTIPAFVMPEVSTYTIVFPSNPLGGSATFVNKPSEIMVPYRTYNAWPFRDYMPPIIDLEPVPCGTDGIYAGEFEHTELRAREFISAAWGNLYDPPLVPRTYYYENFAPITPTHIRGYVWAAIKPNGGLSSKPQGENVVSSWSQKALVEWGAVFFWRSEALSVCPTPFWELENHGWYGGDEYSQAKPCFEYDEMFGIVVLNCQDGSVSGSRFEIIDLADGPLLASGSFVPDRQSDTNFWLRKDNGATWYNRSSPALRGFNVDFWVPMNWTIEAVYA